MTQNITIDQARIKLGKKAETMTDKQIKGILDLLYSLSFRVISQLQVKENYVS